MQKARRLTGRIMNQPRTFRSGIIQTSSVSRFLFQSSSVRLPQVSGRSAATLKMIATNFILVVCFRKQIYAFSPIGCKDFRPKIQLFFESTNASVQDGFTSLVRRRCRGRHICKNRMLRRGILHRVSKPLRAKSRDRNCASIWQCWCLS